ncbi:MAG: hypothetical protein JWM73_1729 [Solirubrobacterales bacterium]|jgi:hypothetical protein|nr:hypothetical protein [Solirubrobacterales bacterium]
MSRTGTPREIPFNPTDPWFTSLANNAEFLFGSLEAAGVRSVMEVGAYDGELTRLLLDWAAPHGGRVVAIDPDPQPPLARMADERDDLELVRALSHDALEGIELTDAVILDGDHNYFTVAGELRLIAEAAGDGALPLLLFHDVGWPHGRRDAYCAVDQIPADARPHPVIEGGGLFPGDAGIRPDGLPMWGSAAREGGERNGVLTAIEDFIDERDGLRLAIIPSFFGFGVLWETGAPYADALEDLLGPWDRHPVLQRLEDSRVLFLASSHGAFSRDERKYHLLKRLLMSRTFRIAQGISKLANRGEPAITRQEVEDRLSETDRAGFDRPEV